MQSRFVSKPYIKLELNVESLLLQFLVLVVLFLCFSRFTLPVQRFKNISYLRDQLLLQVFTMSFSL